MVTSSFKGNAGGGAIKYEYAPNNAAPTTMIIAIVL
jgi:hypothetical protein